MNLEITRTVVDGSIRKLTGDESLTAPRVDEVVDPNAGAVTVPADISGVGNIIKKLQSASEIHGQGKQTHFVMLPKAPLFACFRPTRKFIMNVGAKSKPAGGAILGPGWTLW